MKSYVRWIVGGVALGTVAMACGGDGPTGSGTTISAAQREQLAAQFERAETRMLSRSGSRFYIDTATAALVAEVVRSGAPMAMITVDSAGVKDRYAAVALVRDSPADSQMNGLILAWKDTSRVILIVGPGFDHGSYTLPTDSMYANYISVPTGLWVSSAGTISMSAVDGSGDCGAMPVTYGLCSPVRFAAHVHVTASDSAALAGNEATGSVPFSFDADSLPGIQLYITPPAAWSIIE